MGWIKSGKSIQIDPIWWFRLDTYTSFKNCNI